MLRIEIDKCRNVHASTQMAMVPVFQYLVVLHSIVYHIGKIIQRSSIKK